MKVLDTERAATRPRPPRPARQVGYLVGAVVNGVLLWLVNVEPGWAALPFLTSELSDVLPLVNASIVVGALANLVYVAADPPWLRAAGDVVVTAVGLVALVTLWRVFPFDFTGQSFDWALLVRWVLGVGVIGSLIGIGVALATLTRGAFSPR